MQFLESLRDEADLGQPSIASEADNVVRVMSVHRSKGLEFPVVFLPDLGKRINFSDCQGTILTDRSAGLGMAVVDEERMIRYPSLASVLVQQRLRQQALAEELRVLYVAMTGREHLVSDRDLQDAMRQPAWSNKWASHVGPFPGDMVLGAKCLLDWLGPTAAGAGEEVLRITQHTAEEVAAWQLRMESGRRCRRSKRRWPSFGRSIPAPLAHRSARRSSNGCRLSIPSRRLLRVPAAEAVTSRSNPEWQAQVDRQDSARPRFLAGQVHSPADVGSATHLVLMHLDFAAGDLDRQIESMVERHLVSAEQAAAVDRAAIGWLLGSKIGRF